jgi:epoxyqueuosine reductase
MAPSLLLLEERIKAHARRLGFDLVGIAAAADADDFGRLVEWLDRDFAGEMAYMSRHAEARRHPASILPEVRSVIMVGMNYKPAPDDEQKDAAARVARYAQGADYHDVLRGKLKQLLAWLRNENPGCQGRAVVDTAPLLERDFARRAGLGWIGKNTMLLNTRLGSYFFLGALLVSLDLKADVPHASSHCGTCTACLEACPTGAFAGPFQLDARRCISYLTIELRGPVPEEHRPGVADWLFGCDICQEVCPWNSKAPASAEAALRPHPDLVNIDAAELLSLSDEAFRRRFRGTALTRAGRAGLLRNAAIVLGNRGDPAALPALRNALADPEQVVSEAAQWAIDQIIRQVPDQLLPDQFRQDSRQPVRTP